MAGALAGVLGSGPIVPAVHPQSAAYAATGQLFRKRPKREGDILKIFEKQRVYVVTNEDAALADLLLDGAAHRERRILSVAEWQKATPGELSFVTTVFLINRERLPIYQRVPDRCPAEGDELYFQALRQGRQWGVAHEVTISAPDASWLRQAVSEFRRWSEAPRQAQKRNVASLAVIPVGAGGTLAAEPLLAVKRATGAKAAPASAAASPKPPMAHLVPMDRLDSWAGRMTAMDEALLIDRSALPRVGVPATLVDALAKHTVAINDTVAWRESKPNGRSRIVFSAPNADLLAQAVRTHAGTLEAIAETPTVISTARDLRSVRRVAVAGVRSGAGGSELARRLASRAATEVRSLDAFEVLERAGLSEMLGEVALGQAGITESKDRARVRRLAAADALLIVEITDVNGRTDYAVSHERVTPRLAGPPKKPLEPSRLKYAVEIPGKEDDPIVRAVSEGLLKKVVGTKSNKEFKADLNRYNNEILPAWQRQVDEYHHYARTRPVTWRQNITSRSEATITGSLRLVDLVDGLVLWEAPFSASDIADTGRASRALISHGEDSAPPGEDGPSSSSDVPDELLSRAADSALMQGIQVLRGTALLPSSIVVSASAPHPVAPAPSAAPIPPAAPGGRILDVDGDTVLVGLGATDGLAVGDALLVTLPDGEGTVRLVVTRARPRTCDAAFDADAPVSLRARVEVGMTAAKAAKVEKKAEEAVK